MLLDIFKCTQLKSVDRILGELKSTIWALNTCFYQLVKPARRDITEWNSSLLNTSRERADKKKTSLEPKDINNFWPVSKTLFWSKMLLHVVATQLPPLVELDCLELFHSGFRPHLGGKLHVAMTDDSLVVGGTWAPTDSSRRLSGFQFHWWWYGPACQAGLRRYCLTRVPIRLGG